MAEIAVTLSHIGKQYSLPESQPFLKLWRLKSDKKIWALKNIDLTIYKGDRIGIVGPNGAGKTTLLRIIAGITRPTTGTVKVNGRVAALMDLEAGFHPDLSGIENIYINGLLIGMPTKEIDYKLSQIIGYAGLGRFINAPFRTYSSGMKFRLAFAVAIASECDILVLDEVFLAGDFDFQLKTLRTIKTLQNQRHITMITCSHAPAFIWNLARTFYALDKGELSPKSQKTLLAEINTKHALWTAAFKVKYKSITE